MANKEKGTIMGNRIYFLDNLRIFMFFLVVLVHAGGVSESSGTWASFWIVDDPSTNNLSGLLFLIMDIFMMPTIFFISGFFTPLSMKNKKGYVFLKSKFKRLIIPWVIAVLTLIPLYKIIFLYSRNLPQESWTTYFHWSNGIWSQNWLWFLPVLFLFNILYLLFSKVKVRIPKITLKRAVWATFLIGFVYSAGMDIFGLRGWTKIGFLDFQNERLLIYFMVFLLGALCFKLKVFDAKVESKLLYHIANSIAWIPITAYIFFLLYPWFKPGNYIVSEITHKLILWLSFHLSLLCMLYVMINTFRYYLNKQGKISKELNRNSYYVYIIHVIVMGGIALIMLNTAIPSLLKFLLLTVSTFGASNLIISLYRKIITSKILNNRMEKSTMKTVTTAMLLVILLAVTGCPKQENSDKEQRPPRVSLHAAALQGNLDAIRQHINAGSELNKKDAYGSSPLIVAVTFGKTEVARALIEAGADMQITNNEGSTPLHIAAFFCRTEIVKALLDKGADKNALNKAGRTALETVAGPFDDIKGIYDSIGKGLKPLGLKLDYERIKRTRPRIAEMLR
ncbi:MAG: acyltransferase family protein [Planctomycetes bacterium]|nr:acyltransferase family protein [Planctomycetota bacterium]MBL7144106.1 acyltransferase family protein [Phycisphaerae bacterium]